MKTILITGRMGVGKSQLLSYLKKRTYPVFSADEAVKNLMRPESPFYKEVKKVFPDPELYQESGHFDKKKLADFIFNNPKKKKALEQIIHPIVRVLFKEFVQKEGQKGSSYLFYEAPLISKEILKSCDFSILVVSSYDKQEERLLKQGWKKQEIKERLKAQLPEEDFMQKVDFIIENNKDRKSLEKELDKIVLSKISGSLSKSNKKNKVI